MIKVLYVSLLDKQDPRLIGVFKKVYSIQNALKKAGYETAFAHLNGALKIELESPDEGTTTFQILEYVTGSGLMEKYNKRKEILSVLSNNVIDRYKPNIIILRFIMADQSLIRTFKKLKHYGIRIVLDVPTYPYDKELGKSCYSFLRLLIDKLYRRMFKKYVDLVYSPSDEPCIFGIENIQVTNGIDCSSISIKKLRKYDDDIHFISVANVSFWHGYDRIIKGMYEYYQGNPSRTVHYHCVGEGEALPALKQLTNDLRLNKYVVFHGAKTGEELDKVFDESDVAIGSLGFHRTGLKSGSPLKGREYCARGIPFVIGYDDQDFSESFPYILKIPPDESPVDINKIVEWYEELTHSHPGYSTEMRKYAEEHLSWDATMKPVIEKIKEIAEEEGKSRP